MQCDNLSREAGIRDRFRIVALGALIENAWYFVRVWPLGWLPVAAFSYLACLFVVEKRAAVCTATRGYFRIKHLKL